MSQIFISHAERDRAWAEWVRWHLEAAGYATELGDWPVGTNVIEATNRALDRENPMLVLLSTAYLESGRLATAEWTARLAQRLHDPGAKLIPLRIDHADLRAGLWAPIAVPDLFGRTPDRAAATLVAAVRGVLDPPGAGPGGNPPPYPGAAPEPVADAGPRPPGSLPRVWNPSRRNPAFTGRDAMLNRLRDALTSGQAAAVQALRGLGGVGKTQLALEYAYRFAGEYDLVWWLPSERPELIGDHLVGLAVELGLVPPDTPNPDAVKRLRAHLRGHSRWLLIFDNAESREDLEPWLPEGPGHLLITSRNPAWTGVARPIDVDVFARTESTGLLQAHLPGLGDHDADRLAEALGDLPLAIGQAAELLTETHLDIDVYLGELRAHAGELLRDGRPPAGYGSSLAAAVTVAAQRLTEGDRAAGALLGLCAHLGPEPVPTFLFTEHPDLLSPVLAEVARRPVAFARTAAQLSRYGLARTTDTGPLLHRLTQAVLRDTDAEAGTHRRVVERLVVAAVPDDNTVPSTWPRWAQLLPHILACGPETSDNAALRLAANDAVWHLVVRGDAHSALDLAEQLLSGWIDRYGHDDETTLVAANTLAVVYRELGRYRDAHDLHEETLARRRRLLGPDHPQTLVSAGNLATCLRHLGELERARDLNEDTLTRERRVLGEDGYETLLSAANRAVDLFGLGHLEEACALGDDTLTRMRRVLGEDHPDTLASAYDLADYLWRTGRRDRARKLGADTLARRRRALGDDHRDTVLSAASVVDYLDEMGERDEAAALRRQFPSAGQ